MSFVEIKLISKVHAKSTGLVMMSSFLTSSILLRHEQRLTQFTFQEGCECSHFSKSTCHRALRSRWQIWFHYTCEEYDSGTLQAMSSSWRCCDRSLELFDWYVLPNWRDIRCLGILKTKPTIIVLTDLVFFLISNKDFIFQYKAEEKYFRPEENSVTVPMQVQVIPLSVKTISKIISTLKGDYWNWANLGRKKIYGNRHLVMKSDALENWRVLSQ